MTQERPVPILYVIHSLGHGGMERQVAALATTLDRNRFEPHIATVVGGFREAEVEAAGVPVMRLPVRGYMDRSIVGVVKQLRAFIRSKKVGVVHVFDPSLAPLAALAALGTGAQLLTSQRFEMATVQGKYRYGLLAAHAVARKIVVNSEYLRRYLQDRYHLAGRRIELCHNGLDPDLFLSEPRERLREVATGALVVGSVCVLRPEKNLDILLQAFQRTRHLFPGSLLLIVGSGPEEERLKSTARKLEIADECVFLPTTTDVARVLRSIDIFVHPSLSEGLPNGVMEAMAAGTAVLASRVGGIPELIEDRVSGLLAEPGSLGDFTTQLKILLTCPEVRERVAQAGSARIRQSFTLDASARRMEQIYLGCLP